MRGRIGEQVSAAASPLLQTIEALFDPDVRDSPSSCRYPVKSSSQLTEHHKESILRNIVLKCRPQCQIFWSPSPYSHLCRLGLSADQAAGTSKTATRRLTRTGLRSFRTLNQCTSPWTGSTRSQATPHWPPGHGMLDTLQLNCARSTCSCADYQLHLQRPAHSLSLDRNRDQGSRPEAC